MKKKWPFVVASAVVVYFVLLQVLVYVESFAADASINSLSDAVWFSVVTLTTVGYGDFFPVTMIGRVIGILFLLLSTGFLTFLIGVVISLMTRKVFPLLRLSLAKKKSWYIFSELNAESAVLAEKLGEENPEGVFIFLQQAEEKEHLVGQFQKLQCYCLAFSLENILKVKGKNRRNCYVYFMGADGYGNYRDAKAALDFHVKVYCQTEFEPDVIPDGLTVFNRYDGCARLYWRKYPLEAGEQCVIMIGCGKYGTELLERALLVNVFGPLQHVEYHVFGDASEFLRNHTELGLTLSLNQKLPGKDVVIFHEDFWNSDRELLERADRIILCQDSEEENLAAFRQLKRYFAVGAKVYMQLPYTLEDVMTFGKNSELFEPELVMRTRLNQTAIAMNEIYRKSVTYEAPTWEQLGEFLRQSNIAAAEHLLTKMHILLGDASANEVTAAMCGRAYKRYLEQREEKADLFREIEHERWMRFYSLHNWRYDPVRNNAKRRHPALRPFAELPETEQAKDDYAWELLGALAKEI